LKATTIQPSGKRMLADCWCETCRPITFEDMRMVVCPMCGNKRCPHANDHRNVCTDSNEPGQPGSSWAHVKPFAKRMRQSRPKSTPARKAAKGQECMVRIPGICNRDPETTVLAHYRLAGYCGTGMKPDDEAFGAWASSACHDECDRRTRLEETEYVRLCHAEGVLRTIAARGEA
jgi:hypothetical protein